MGFGEYLWKLLHRPFKFSEDIRRFTTVIGSLLDDTKQVIFAVRRVWFLRTCPVEVLGEFGNEYGMPQLTGESDEQYRTRLINVFDWYYWMGTNYGVLRVISFVLNVECRIREYQVDCWKLGRNHLGRDTRLFDPSYLYKFGLYFARELTSDEEQLVRKVVNAVKEAHTIFILKYPTPERQTYWRLGKARLGRDTILFKGVNYQ